MALRNRTVGNIYSWAGFTIGSCSGLLFCVNVLDRANGNGNPDYFGISLFASTLGGLFTFTFLMLASCRYEAMREMIRRGDPQ